MNMVALPVALMRIIEEIATAREHVLGVTTALSQPQSEWRPSPGEWSAGEILDHLIRAEAGSARLIAGLAKRTTAVSPPYPESMVEFAWRAPTTDDRWLVMVPEPTAIPTSDRDVAELRRELADQAALTERALARLASFDPRSITFRHVLIADPMDLAQWGRFIAFHLRVHGKQLDDITALLPRDR
jgi:hypothetical protein